MRPQIGLFVDPEDAITVDWRPAVTYPGCLTVDIGQRVNIYFEDRAKARRLAEDILARLDATKADESKPTHVADPATETCTNCGRWNSHADWCPVVPLEGRALPLVPAAEHYGTDCTRAAVRVELRLVPAADDLVAHVGTTPDSVR
jgi:hypothetical protein